MSIHTPPFTSGATLQDRLDRMAPAAREASLGDCLYDLINGLNATIAVLKGANVAGAATLTPVLLPEQR